MIAKATLRREVRSRLTGLSGDDLGRMGAQVAKRFWRLPEMESARVVLIYASSPGEVPTDGIAVEARARGMVLVYPRCIVDRSELSLHAVDSVTALRANGSFGLREPAPDCPLVEIGDIEVALIPGLAWDRHGNRLGRGGGYYDRLLAGTEWRAFRCGLFLSVQELETIPHDPWDSPLDAVVTETEIVRFDHRHPDP
jgi:5-formyltetrahydrofolate cyclo-ligase